MNPIVRPSQHIFKVPKACYGKAIHDCCMTSGSSDYGSAVFQNTMES